MIQHPSFKSWLPVAIFFLGTVQAVPVPGCQTVAPQQKVRTNVRTARASIPNNPFGQVFAYQKDIAFVSLDSTLGNNTLGPDHKYLHMPSLPNPSATAYVTDEGALGIALTNDGRCVLVFTSPRYTCGRRCPRGSWLQNAVVGTLNDTTPNQMPGIEAVEVTVSLDDRYAFVSQEYGSELGVATPGNIDVIRLEKPTSN